MIWLDQKNISIDSTKFCSTESKILVHLPKIYQVNFFLGERMSGEI